MLHAQQRCDQHSHIAGPKSRLHAARTLCQPDARILQYSTPGRSRDANGQIRRRLCSLQTHAQQQNNMLRGIDPEFQLDVARIIELAERAAGKSILLVSDFQPPPVVDISRTIIRGLADVSSLAWGGFSSAERCRLLVGPDDRLPPEPDRMALPDPGNQLPALLSDAVTALSVTGNFMFDAATHRDFLGAVLGTGIDRSKVGDIILTSDKGAQILVDPALAEFLCDTLTQVRSIKVETRPMAAEDLQVAAPRVEQRTSVEASTRVDAVASAGFRMSRSKMADLIKKGDVRINWKPVKSTNQCKAGDVISCSGKGRVEIGSIEKTKKGKFAVELTRLL